MTPSLELGKHELQQAELPASLNKFQMHLLDRQTLRLNFFRDKVGVLDTSGN
jgi:hypothetical protein